MSVNYWGVDSAGRKRLPCSEDPVKLAGQPLGMYHCPDCGAMQMAGMEHLPPEADYEEVYQMKWPPGYEMESFVCSVAPSCRIILGVVDAEIAEDALLVATKKYRGLFLAVRKLTENEVKCPNCKGEAVIDDRQCQACKATGVVSKGKDG